MPRESRNIRGNLKEDFSWWFYSLLFAKLVAEASKGPFLLIRTQCSWVIYVPTVPRIFPQASSFLGVGGPSESPVLPTESRA